MARTQLITVERSKLTVTSLADGPSADDYQPGRKAKGGWQISRLGPKKVHTDYIKIGVDKRAIVPIIVLTLDCCVRP